MTAINYEDLKRHIGHKIVVVAYAEDEDNDYIQNVSCECETCNEVLMDFDRNKQ
jgi:hypothetical protein